ncbi:MAG: LysR substrate-binding domain-containing protein [Christensenellales bacterium]|jgi:DNA-binding transcriptional LysR family regulator
MNPQIAKDIHVILKAGSITGAAKSLYISQSALSQRIKREEELLGVELLDRTALPITLTYAGEKYMDAMQKINGITSALLNELNEIEDEAQGTIRLGISRQRGMQLLPLVFPEFVRLYPNVHIDLIEYGSDTLERMLHEGLCDVALITTSPRYADLEYDLLETEEVVLVAAKNSAFAQAHCHLKEVSINLAREEPFVALTSGHSVRAFQDDLFRHYHMAPPILLETENLEAAKRIAAEGVALMLCPLVFITQSPDVQSKVVCLRIKNNHYKRHFYFSYRKDLFLPRFMIDFRNIVQQKLSQFEV